PFLRDPPFSGGRGQQQRRARGVRWSGGSGNTAHVAGGPAPESGEGRQPRRLVWPGRNPSQEGTEGTREEDQTGRRGTDRRGLEFDRRPGAERTTGREARDGCPCRGRDASPWVFGEFTEPEAERQPSADGVAPAGRWNGSYPGAAGSTGRG